jgi:tetratricopeptide (TPR) repeat protein
MAQMPPEQWGVVVKNYTELYPDIGAYTKQLRELEAKAKQEPNDPALQFLLGYHYNYLGYPKDAQAKLERAIELAPQDVAAKMLLDVAQGKTPTPPEVNPAEGAPPNAAPGATPPPTGSTEPASAPAGGAEHSPDAPPAATAPPTKSEI